MTFYYYLEFLTIVYKKKFQENRELKARLETIEERLSKLEQF